MICPFCQNDLNIEDMSCPNCAACYPRKAMPFGIKLRTLALSGGMLLISAMILNDCVLNYLPGGRNSHFYAPGSPQVQYGPGPHLKGADALAQLRAWQSNRQGNQSPTGAMRPEGKHH